MNLDTLRANAARCEAENRAAHDALALTTPGTAESFAALDRAAKTLKAFRASVAKVARASR